MGAPFLNNNQAFVDEINRRITVFGQVTSGQTLMADRLDMLYYTVSETASIYNPASDEDVVSWLQLRTAFDDFNGEPEYRTLQRVFTGVKSIEKSAHWRIPNKVKRTFEGTQSYDALAGAVGQGEGQAQRQTLIRQLATAESLECFDGQNLADTDHPGKRYDSATNTHIDLTQINLALATAFNDAAVDTAVSRMTAYHDEAGNHYGNKYDEYMDQPSTNDIRTQAPLRPQFHVFAGSTAITNVKNLARTMNTTSTYAGRFSYSKVDELPPKRWIVRWLNTAQPLPGVPEGFIRPFLRKYDGVTIHVTGNGEHLDQQRFKMHEINAHSEYGFGPLFWHLLYVGEEP